MASNAFGQVFKMTTWGESHGKAMGVVIDGCPPGIEITEEYINQELSWRKPGWSAYTSPRQETDQVEILSGVFNQQTTGAPISLIIWNKDVQSQTYEATKDLLKPGHAQYTYLKKYGCFDYRGGGRASARETVCRVAAGAIAKKILSDANIFVLAYLSSVGPLLSQTVLSDVKQNYKFWLMQKQKSEIFCIDNKSELKIKNYLKKIKLEGDSIGGVVEALSYNVPVALGDPVYEKIEANLAKAMLSIPASKGFEIGDGFQASTMKGSTHNDLFDFKDNQVQLTSNHAGGTLGGITTGQPINIRVSFKPTSSIEKKQHTLDLNNKHAEFIPPPNTRHDPCVAIRAVPVVEAMFALVLVDAFLINKIITR